MMSSSRSKFPGVHSSRRSGSRQEGVQYIMFAVVAILVVIIVLVVAFGTRRGGGVTRTSGRNRGTTSGTLVQERDASRRSQGDVTSRSSRRDRRKRTTAREPRERRRRERLERKAASRITVRSSRGGYAFKRTGSPVLQAIISQPNGERVAVVGNRQVRKGDLIEGRRITEVGPDRVKVEYFTKTYEVKLNQPIY